MNHILNQFLRIILYCLDYSLKKYKSYYLYKLKRFLLGINTKVIYVVEEDSWAIEWVGKNIIENLKNLKLINAEITTPQIYQKKIFHFGSINCLIIKNRIIKPHKSNKIVLTWFHINPLDKRIKFIPIINKFVDYVHTSNNITANQLKKYGFDENKIIIIPLGVDISHFKIFNDKKRNSLKEKYNIPKNKIIIGSFQKDSVGWGEGLKPKLVKGPDIFCQVVNRLSKDYEIHIFLTGPARGYVKKQLEDYGIPYTHIFLKNYLDIVECYNILDLYLVTSRIEGGPLAILEGMATGVPIVTTNVGMVPEIIQNGLNGFITEIEDIDKLCQFSISIIKNKDLREKFIANGLKSVQNFSWKEIAKEYYEKIYKRLL